MKLILTANYKEEKKGTNYLLLACWVSHSKVRSMFLEFLQLML